MVNTLPPRYAALQPVGALGILENRLRHYADAWGDPQLAAQLQDRVPARARFLIEQLQSKDRGAARQAGEAVQRLCFGMSAPTSTWFGTPLGVLVFHALYRTEEATPQDDALTRAEAAELLGVSRQRVHALINAGQIEAHRNGGVTRASVSEMLLARESAEIVALLNTTPSARGVRLNLRPTRSEEVIRVQALGPEIDAERVTRWVLAQGGRLAISAESDQAHAAPEFAGREFLLVPLGALGRGGVLYDAD